MKKKKSFWDRISFIYDAAESLNKKAYQGMLTYIAALVPKDAKVLECAAGTGAISIAVAPRASQVFCTDLSLPMLERAQAKARKRELHNISFAERDLLHLTEEDESYDVVIAANVVHLLDSPQEALKELWRVTRKNGILVVPTFLTKSGGTGFTFLISLYKLIGFRPKHSFKEEEYLKMMKESGLLGLDFEVIQGRMPVGIAVFRK